MLCFGDGWGRWRMTNPWLLSLDSWQALKLELHLEAERIFVSSGEVVLVTPDGDSKSVVTLASRTKSLRLTWVPERNAIRWEIPTEYGFERIRDNVASLARSFMQRVARNRSL
jgi:hypothetical protein